MPLLFNETLGIVYDLSKSPPLLEEGTQSITFSYLDIKDGSINLYPFDKIEFLVGTGDFDNPLVSYTSLPLGFNSTTSMLYGEYKLSKIDSSGTLLLVIGITCTRISTSIPSQMLLIHNTKPSLSSIQKTVNIISGSL